jgi:antitoxin MazE
MEVIMPEAILDIKRWGNNLGVRLPAAVARAAHLYVDQRVRISVEDRIIVIQPVEEAEPTLDEWLAHFDPARHGGEAMRTQAVGAELW